MTINYGLRHQSCRHRRQQFTQNVLVLPAFVRRFLIRSELLNEPVNAPCLQNTMAHTHTRSRTRRKGKAREMKNDKRAVTTRKVKRLEKLTRKKPNKL